MFWKKPAAETEPGGIEAVEGYSVDGCFTQPGELAEEPVIQSELVPESAIEPPNEV